MVPAMCLLALGAISQTPVVMSSQSGFSYTETFSDVSNWVFATSPANGTFTAGIGAAAWKGIDAVTSTPSIPNATRITALSNVFQTPSGGTPPTYSSGLYRSTGDISLLSTGTTDNSTSVAVDFFLNFTGVNAGTLSFDWASINNSTGNRAGSLRVYASTDGTNFTEIVAAQVLNFINNSPTSGSIANVALPASFNNSATARLRFYYHNGSGGSSGSRPRVSLDNVKVTALSTNACTAPTAQPTGFALGTVIHNSIQFSFTAASPAPQNYLVVMSTNNALTSQPVNGVNYSLGDNIGDGTVISLNNSTSITANGLSLSTTYYFFIFSMNNTCTGGPLYLTTGPLTGNATTLAGALPCAVPAAQPTALTFTTINTNSITASFTASANTDEYLVVRTTAASFTGSITNGTVYNAGTLLGNGTVVSRSAATTFSTTGLSSGTQYYFFIYALNSQNCSNGPTYNTTSPLTANANTSNLALCVAPTAQPTGLNLSAANTTINGSFTPATNVDNYLVIRSTASTLSATPQNSNTYAVGTTLGGGTVIGNSSATSFVSYNLTASTQYYYFVFAFNSVCNGGPLYLTASPLTASATTTTVAPYNYYFGNLHAHSDYSDGNADNSSLTPLDDYNYAKNSLCMDFLGISEHNHSEAGMHLSSYQLGINQSLAATTSNFLALYGMEWGVISNGGHVLVYGINQLIGWESGNYNVYVAKSDYIGTPETTGTTGLFRTINNWPSTAFASCAHPSSTDYNNIANIPYSAVVDSALRGTAVASGPAFSTNTTYNDPPSAMAYLSYYNKLLAKGYHVGPTMDHDSHNTNFGRSSNNRLAVIAPTLTQTDLLNAMKARHFYATEDCDTRVNFTINNQIMGSIITGTTAPGISVYAVDPTNTAATPSIKLMYGVPGSGITATQVASATGNALSYTDFSLSNSATAYYYADITIAGNRTITAPIWYTKTAAVPITLLSFNASLNSNRTVHLSWKTSNEINNKLFVVEKSYNGIAFFSMDSVNAKNIGGVNDYSINDLQPNDGVNYYRLKQIDNDGRFTYSNIVSVNLKKGETNAFNVYPNPVKNVATLNINSTATLKAKVTISDIMGRIVSETYTNLVKGNQSSSLNVSSLKTGNYQVTIFFGNESITQKLVKE